MSWVVTELPQIKRNQFDAIAIKDISPTQTKFNVIGIIISKLPLRKFVKNEDGKKHSQAVLTFTIRDSLYDWINGSFWGTFANVSTVASGFSIGDCVMVVGARAKSKVEGSYEDQFMIKTPTEYHLTLNDSCGNITHFDFPDKAYTARLKSALTVPLNQHLKLHQVIQYAHSHAVTRNVFSSEHIWNQDLLPKNLFTFLAAVAEIGQPKAIILNRRRPTFSDSYEQQQSENVAEMAQRCELIIFDETCARLPLILWNEDWIHTALSAFIPNVTILSIVDCPVRYDDYRRGVVAAPNSRTLIIVSPECPEANRLSQYAKHVGSRSVSAMDVSDFHSAPLQPRFTQPMPSLNKRPPAEIYSVPLTSIHNIVTVRELKAGRITAGYGIVFALITKIDLDRTDMSNLVTLQCANCQRRMLPCDPPADIGMSAPGKPVQVEGMDLYAMCTTPDCPLTNQRFSWSDSQHTTLDFGTMINLSDHTGTYFRTLLGGEAMRKLVGCTPPQFIRLTCRERAHLKWNICLRRYKVYFWSDQSSFNNPIPLLTVIACEKPSSFEVMHSLRNQAPEDY
ncbi:Meiosis-specific with OB domain-containing protein [Clonorchis sinensis]|uniref:Meiosis-specific with OB domain-containing protein n=1 Tax=Clonorchis sinensis TaxID=79923 RepID=A0A8T1M725_CLOSI|nr:Meiosis-specific with OB domain-containing protein [Clonorchis sinensis]